MKTLVILFGLIGCSSNNGHNKEIGEKTQIQEYEVVQKSVIGDDLYVKRRTPKMSDLEVISLNLTAEYLSVDSELQLFRKLYISFNNRIKQSGSAYPIPLKNDKKSEQTFPVNHAPNLCQNFLSV